MSEVPATPAKTPTPASARPRGWIATTLALGALVVAIGYSLLSGRSEGAPSPSPLALSVVPEYPTERMGLLPGDPLQGERLYHTHCAACHGLRGHGDGPASSYIYPPVRDHSDGTYMNHRSNDELQRAILQGGAAVERSPLMPRWDDKFSSLDGWDLVAYMRKLHPRLTDLFPEARRTVLQETVLDAERAKEVQRVLRGALATEEFRSPSLRVYGAEDRLLGFYGTSRFHLLGEESAICIALDTDGRISAVTTWPRLVLRLGPREFPTVIEDYLASFVGRDGWDPIGPSDPDPLASYPGVRAGVDRAARAAVLRLRAAMDQGTWDAAEAESVYAAMRSDAKRFPAGQQVYFRLCAVCHGATGKAVGPGVTQGAFTPRNLCDGARLNPLPDDYLRNLILRGGLWARIGSAMPASKSSLSPEELEDMLRYLRSIASPPYPAPGGSR